MSEAQMIETPGPDALVFSLREGDCLRIAGAVMCVRRAGIIEVPAGTPVDFDVSEDDEWTGGCLVISLHPGDQLLLEGVLATIRGNPRVELLTHSRLLFGRQYMPEREATTPTRRLYFLLQQTYAGPEGEREVRLAELRRAVEDSEPFLGEEIEGAVDSGKFYPVIRRLRDMVRDEAASSPGLS